MADIVLTGNTSGAITIAAPAVAGTNTLTLPAETGTILTSNTSTGKILQVLSTTKTDTFTTTSTSLVDITGLSVAITPSATSSKILVICNVGYHYKTGKTPAMSLLRDSTVIGQGAAAGSRVQTSFPLASNTPDANNDITSTTINFLDSPSTTSSTTYKVQTGTVISGTMQINRTTSDVDNNNYARTVSTITVMEVAG